MYFLALNSDLEPEDLVAAASGAVGDARSVAQELTGIDVTTLTALDGDAAAAYADSVNMLRLVRIASQAAGDGCELRERGPGPTPQASHELRAHAANPDSTPLETEHKPRARDGGVVEGVLLADWKSWVPRRCPQPESGRRGPKGRSRPE